MAGASEHKIKIKQEMKSFMRQATSLTETAPILKNHASPRSCATFLFELDDQSLTLMAFLYIVDLTGSETARDIAV